MRCPACSFENPDNARFCNQCGTELSSSAARSDDRSFYERIHDLDPFAPYQDPYAASSAITQTLGPKDDGARDSADTIPLASAASAAPTRPFDSASTFDGNATIPFAATVTDTAVRDAHAVRYPDGTPYDGPDEEAKAFRGELSKAEARQLKREQKALDKEARKQSREARREQQRTEKEELKLLAAAEKARTAGARPGSDDQGRGLSMPSASKHRRKRIAIFAIALSCALIVAAAIVTYSMQLWGGRAVPDVVGMTRQAATDVLQQAGFSVETEDARSDEAPDTVLACDPAVGYRVEPGSRVVLQVAVARTVPAIVGKTQAEAEAMLAEEGLQNVSFEFERSDETADAVLSVAPAAGSSVLSTTAVTVTVAQPYTVPDVVGKNQDEAKAAIEEAGFVAAMTRVNDEEAEEGVVLSTDPSAGEKRASGTTVTVSVAHHRSAEAIELTRKFLTASSEMTIKGQTCVVDEVKSITYAGDNTCEFSIVMRPFETHTWMFGWGTETRYGNPETVNGRIVWNDNDDIVSVEPSMKQGA